MISNICAGYIAIEYGLGGPNFGLVSACASGTHSIGEALFLADRVLVLTGARTFGYAFDPLTTYFVLAKDGSLEGILAPTDMHAAHGHATIDRPLQVIA